MNNNNLLDAFGRQLTYLRLSITKKCNFKCIYCLPYGYDRASIVNELTPLEFCNLVSALCELGIEKVRLTGGEPTCRTDFFTIVEKLRQISNLKTLCLTTNGYSLKKHAQKYLDSGITHINVSVDSLDTNTFHKLTGVNILDKVLEGIYHCLTLGFSKIKINAVLLKTYNYSAIENYLNFVKKHNVDIRFITLMPTVDNKQFYQQEYITAEQLVTFLQNNNWQPVEKTSIDGPATTFYHPNYSGKIGLINPYDTKFCASCNRLRVDSHGNLLMCLLNFGNYNLRPLLQSIAQKEELKLFIRSLLVHKPKKNLLNEDNNIISNYNFSKIGG